MPGRTKIVFVYTRLPFHEVDACRLVLLKLCGQHVCYASFHRTVILMYSTLSLSRWECVRRYFCSISQSRDATSGTSMTVATRYGSKAKCALCVPSGWCSSFSFSFLDEFPSPSSF
uniref:Uncharacterized protein n=1 Tax=Trypanosoma vivax (strain Y486) TaxID=1055687 RepID=G0UD53_TRYVY|nr:hypothetical protein TVY486_1112470 [Trypanosoma vivax Y486]